MSRPFLKMNGLGNDFAVVDARRQPFTPSQGQVRAIADRRAASGCDQLIAIEPSSRADAFMRIWNADGGQVDACGNASRCIGWLVMQERGTDHAVLETNSGLIDIRLAGAEQVTVDMGEPRLRWDQIPLAEEMDTRGIELQVGPIDAPVMHTPGCVSMGNPHVTFFVGDAEQAPVAEIGPMIEHHRLFPEAVNVGFAQIKGPDRIRLRVWERGAGLTKACGTGACAALVAAHRRGLVGRKAVLELDGGELIIEWRQSDGHVLMTGPVAVDFRGELKDGPT